MDTNPGVESVTAAASPRKSELYWQCAALGPDHFRTTTNIDGLLATDVFTLNTALAATIEGSVVRTLNDLRSVWDPQGEYRTFAFARQPQTFPDVVLREQKNGSEPLLGIELKGWYLLAREELPTFRFTVNEQACSPWDLLVVVPWVLSNVLAGAPELHRPFVALARYCAQARNHYWLHQRSGASGRIIEPEGARPYPAKGDSISDRATVDGGRNFGRLARYGVMKEYTETMRDNLIRGVAVKDWQTFFRKYGAAS